MSAKSNNVLHFKIKPSRIKQRLLVGLNILALVALLTAKLDPVFTILLCLLIILFYIHNRTNSSLPAMSIEFRLDKILLQTASSKQLIPVQIVKIKQTRWFSDILFSNGKTTFNYVFLADNFHDTEQFHLFMYAIRQLKKSKPDNV